ncbi:vanadium-dependent haloperoxidase [Nocardia blacklockiae]|uniref:vanadium-dependent haloperoxidase n=1 Tax=Nocardia blacklockiae TaxID=480036 RepID=UPI001894B2E4|nr:vanadium-dependent haloperoxidase [Nocardia blacklockiae]MBF6172715.1 chloroperoxidase [Nocardia blacklockiae]
MDQILYWNNVALESDRLAHTVSRHGERGVRGPVGSSRALALTHLAMHDAYFGIVPAPHGTYLTTAPSAPAGASADAAVAVAAHTVLTALYPAQTARLDTALQQAGLRGPGTGAGSAHGLAVGQAMLAARADDPDLDDTGYHPDPGPGRHRADPAHPEQGYYAPHYGARARCFAATTRHTLDAPPKQTDPAYEQALREVRGKGIAAELTGTLPPDLARRTPEETLVGTFWGYDGAHRIGTPPRWYNSIVRAVTTVREHTPAQNARLFALVNAAMADAAILAWDDKYRHDLWRPVLGIREHDPSMGPEGVAAQDLQAHCDPFWLPRGAAPTNHPGAAPFTPAYPAYPSGHATLGAAALQLTRRFCGVGTDGPDPLTDGIAFVSDELDGTSVDEHGVRRPRHARTFPGGLWQMIEENGRSRVFLGVHWIFDAFAVDAAGRMDLSQHVGGVRLGLDIAEDLWANGLRASAAAGPRLP